MKTRKSISTLHYIDIDTLVIKLDDLVSKNKISFYGCIEHLKEEDETKNHIHLFIVPNGEVDTDQLRNELEFLDPKNPTKPIRSMPFRSSKFADWYLYSLHDTAYLLSKQQSRKFHYKKDEFRVSDEDYFNELIHEIDFTKFKTQSMVADLAKNGVSFADIVMQGIVPVPLINQYQKLYQVIYSNQLMRNNQTHDNVNPDTGEVEELETPPVSVVDSDSYPWE